LIKFLQPSPKECIIFNDEKQLATLVLVPSTVSNKFSIITKFVEEMSKRSPEFTIWYEKFITDYISDEEKFLVVERNIPELKRFVNEYIDSRNIDFSQFVDESKSKKTSILFGIEEIKRISKLSGYLKVYGLISNSENIKLDQRSHKDIYNQLAADVLNSETAYKIFNVIKTKTFRYNLTDKFMWDYIKTVQCKTIDVHVIEIFNFIMNSILILCEEDRNPITYFVSVVDESVKWFLRSVYKSQVVYADSISTEDIQSPNIDNLKTYSYNDTLGRLKGVAYEQIYETFENEATQTFEESEEPEVGDKGIVNFQNRLMEIKHISPLSEFIVFPILSKITSIPYNHFKTLSEDHAAILSVYVQNLMKKVFKKDYKNIIALLGFYPTNQASTITTYKLKIMSSFINIASEHDNFYGFKTKIILGNILSYFVGRSSRVTFYDLLSGKKLGGVPLSKLEQEIIQFFVLWFSGKLEPEFEKMEKLMNTDF